MGTMQHKNQSSLAIFCATRRSLGMLSLLAAGGLAVNLNPAFAQAKADTKAAAHKFIPLGVFITAFGKDETKGLAALDLIEAKWHESSAAMLIEMVYRVPNQRALVQIVSLLDRVTGSRLTAM